MSIRAIPLAAIFVAALVLPAGASAKGIHHVTVCGADGCSPVRVEAEDGRLIGGGTPGTRPSRAAPFYELRFAIRDRTGRVLEPRLTSVHVPSARKLRTPEGAWLETTPGTARALRRVTQGREPLPASQLESAAAANRRVLGPLPPEMMRAPPAGAEVAPEAGPRVLLALVIPAAMVAAGALRALRRRARGRRAVVSG